MEQEPALVRLVRTTLTRTPQVLNALLVGLPEEVVRADEGPGTWSPRQIVVHLIEGERTDWIRRARIILECGRRRTFEPFEREPPKRVRSTGELIAEFASAREANLRALGEMKLDEADLARKGLHPDFGTVTLRQLLATWAAHDLSHLRQVARVLAKRFAEDAGPWVAYLPVLRERGGASG
jgi:hypothetical protein